MSDIYIAGIAMTVFGRHVDRPLEDLAREALDGAIADAGCSRTDIGAAFYAGMTNGPLQGQVAIPGQVVCSKIGIEGIPIYNVENACASWSSAFNLAQQSLRAGVIRSFTHRRLDEPQLGVSHLAAKEAYEKAGLGPEDIDVAEVHDASAMGEIIQAD